MSSVPDTNTFSLQNVVDVVTPNIHNLFECFESAIPELFDPNYEGNKNSLLNFRNYGNKIVLIFVYEAGTDDILTDTSLGFSMIGQPLGHTSINSFYEGIGSSGAHIYKDYEELEGGSEYYVTVSKTGYNDKLQDVFIQEGYNTLIINIYLNETIVPDTYDVSFNVKNESNQNLENAFVNVSGGGSGYTFSNGNITIEDLPDGTYNYSTSKSGYATTYGSFTIDGSNINVNVVLVEEEDYTCNVDIILHADVGGTTQLPEETYYIEGWMYTYDEAGIITKVISIDRSSIYGTFNNNTISNIPSDYKAVVGYLQVYRIVDGNKQIYEKGFYSNYPPVQPSSGYFNSNENITCYFVLSIESDGSPGNDGDSYATSYLLQMPKQGDIGDEPGEDSSGAPSGLLGML